MPFLDSKAIALADIHFTGFDMPCNAAAVDLESTGAHRVSRCRFTGCGYFPLEIFGGGSIVEDCDFVSNTGRGISMTIPRRQSGIEQRFVRCRFTDNRNVYDVGSSAITIHNAPERVEQCVLSRNNFPSGSGVAVEINWGGSLLLLNSTFCESPGASAIAGGWTDGGGNSFTTSPCAPPCPADIVRDGAVNGASLSTVLVYWDTSGSQYPEVDVDGNGVVNGSELAAVLAAWGQCPQEVQAHASPQPRGFNQFSSVRPSTRANSRVFPVTRVEPSDSAWPAISTSRGPMGVPRASSAARAVA
jgi:hypothetical protein